jgi:hypothetical protein
LSVGAGRATGRIIEAALMPKGGARSRSGPPPTRGAVRNGRNGDAGWIHLSADREGDPPAWPLGRATKFELEQWEREWRRPQAVMWERLGWEIQVALYIRMLRQASGAKMPATLMTNLMSQMVTLGLTGDGLARLRWILPDDAPPEKAAPKRATTASARDRMRVLEGGGNAEAG